MIRSLYKLSFQIATILTLPPRGEHNVGTMHRNHIKRDTMQSLGNGQHRPATMRSSRRQHKTPRSSTR